MTAFHAALLGVVQGLTEFLPISSSAHLILARTFFGWDAGELALAFDVACHVGTLLAVLVYFRRDLASMTAAVPVAWPGNEAAHLLRTLVVGTVPIVIAGGFFADAISSSLRRPEVAGLTLALGAVAMLAAERLGNRSRTETTLSLREALVLGMAQAVALVPGVSRSGAVLTVAMLIGLQRPCAARFAFLLGIPAIVAAAGKATLDLIDQGLPSGVFELFAVGTGASAIVGYLTVTYFIRYLARYSLDVFAVYRLALAGAVLVWMV